MARPRERVAWEHSTRRQRLPPNWQSEIVPAVLERDGHQCQLRYRDVCAGAAREVDHREPGDDHRLSNLQAACTPCHRVKSSREGNTARARRRPPPEIHPALQ